MPCPKVKLHPEESQTQTLMRSQRQQTHRSKKNNPKAQKGVPDLKQEPTQQTTQGTHE